MRHRKDHRPLSRTASHRKAMLRNQVTSLFAHGRIETTVAKAKESRRLAERIITYAKRADVRSAAAENEKDKQAAQVHARRQVARFVHGPDVVKRIFDDIAPWYKERPGGYTRILRTRVRKGDAGEMAILELVKSAEWKASERKAREDAEAAAAPEPKRRGLFRRKKKDEGTPES
jgi:large subunit ribosomal protein L17